MRLLALVEVPRGSFVKREIHGRARTAFVSPLPCPFNYGCIPGQPGPDGDPVDAVVLGARLPRGTLVRREIVGRVRFLDGGLDDPKLVLADRPIQKADRLLLQAFFTFYAHAKAAIRRVTGRPGRTAFLGIEDLHSAG